MLEKDFQTSRRLKELVHQRDRPELERVHRRDRQELERVHRRVRPKQVLVPRIKPRTTVLAHQIIHRSKERMFQKQVQELQGFREVRQTHKQSRTTR